MRKRVEEKSRIKEENGVTGSMIVVMLFLIILVLILTLPNIYLDNQIYRESRKIAHFEQIKRTLEEEQVLIKEKLEAIYAREKLYND